MTVTRPQLDALTATHGGNAALDRLASDFLRGLSDNYASLLLPAGAKSTMTDVETYKVGADTRLRGTLVIEGPAFTARLSAMAAVKNGKVTIDNFPRFDSATCASTQAALTAAAKYATMIQRADTAQLDPKKSLKDAVAPSKFTVNATLLSGGRDLAEVSYESAGFMGRGSTFVETYRVQGKKSGGQTELTGVTYHDNKATDANGVDLDT
jgi:hypothetical protein